MPNIQISVEAKEILKKLMLGDRTTERIGSFKLTEGLLPYRKGPKLIELFDPILELDTEYSNGFSRPYYSKECIRLALEKDKLKELIEQVFHTYHFLSIENGEEILKKCVEEFNRYIYYDGLVLKMQEHLNTYKLESIGHKQELLEVHFGEEYFHNLTQKTYKRIEEKDYDGALTTARSLIEGVFKHIIIEHKKANNELVNEKVKQELDNKDLPLLKKEAMNCLNMDPVMIKNKGLSESYLLMISGAHNIVDSISYIRNKKSDSHSQTENIDPSEDDKKKKLVKHHVRFIFNLSVTLARFFLDSLDFQLAKQKKKSY